MQHELRTTAKPELAQAGPRKRRPAAARPALREPLHPSRPAPRPLRRARAGVAARPAGQAQPRPAHAAQPRAHPRAVPATSRTAVRPRKAAALRELFDANGLILVEALARGVFREADAGRARRGVQLVLLRPRQGVLQPLPARPTASGTCVSGSSGSRTRCCAPSPRTA